MKFPYTNGMKEWLLQGQKQCYQHGRSPSKSHIKEFLTHGSLNQGLTVSDLLILNFSQNVWSNKTFHANVLNSTMRVPI